MGKHLLTEKDFVDVVDEEDNVVGSVPKHWGADQLAPGLKKKGRSSSSSSSSSSGSGSSTPPARKSGEEPKGNASTDEWTAYAREKGATDADLLDADGKPLGQQALREKFGTPAS
ncbi:hypothetical protein [Microcystis phage MinS1]|nr:hypothetical protein [Microcystis phage MinS1]